MEKIEKIIDDFLKNLPQNKLKEIEVLNFLNEILPEKYKENLIFENIKDGIIFLKTSSPFVKNEIYFLKNEIIEKINKRINENFIKDIKIRRGDEKGRKV
ncbi:MAG: DUF721 domain-containing protein [candidate division WOR-3 bacterium]